MRVLVGDLEGSRVPRHLPWSQGAHLSLFCFRSSEGEAKSFVLEHESNREPRTPTQEALVEYVESCDMFVAHNAMFELVWLLHLGVDITKLRVHCTMMGDFHIFAQNTMLGYGLNDLAERYGLPRKLDVVKEYWKAGYDTREIPLSVLTDYCDRDVAITTAIFNRQMEILEDMGLMRVHNIIMEELKELAIASFNGSEFNVEQCQAHSDAYQEELDQIEDELKAILPPEVSLGSGARLSAYLFGGSFKVEDEEWVVRTFKEYSKYYPRKADREVTFPGICRPPRGVKRGKSGYYPTKEEVLSQIKPPNKKVKRLLELFSRWSKLSHTKSTFFDGYLASVGVDGRLHPNYTQHRARTGRKSCLSPNLMNVPRAGKSPVKELFKSRWP